MKTIYTENVPNPLGHYSQAVVSQGFLFVSGLIPIKQDPPHEVPQSIQEQVELVLSYLDAVLIEAGSSRDRVVDVTLFINDIDIWPIVNKIYAEFFKNHYPARCAVPVKELPKGVCIELKATATC